MSTNSPVNPNLESILITDVDGNAVKGGTIVIPIDVVRVRGMYDQTVDILRNANPDADEDIIHTLAAKFTHPLDFNEIDFSDLYPDIRNLLFPSSI